MTSRRIETEVHVEGKFPDRTGGVVDNDPALPAKGMFDAKELYQQVTNQIIESLEKGAFPWEKTWKPASRVSNPNQPYNAVSKRKYTGRNIILLWMQGQKYDSNGWATLRQIEQAGGHVREGETGAKVLFFSSSYISKKERRAAEAENREPNSGFLTMAHTVFNLDQCEGVEELCRIPESDIEDNNDPIQACEDLIHAVPADIRYGGDRAFFAFSPDRDYIGIPHKAQFNTSEDFYRTMFHELTHWTGFKTRLNRNLKSWGTDEYAREELVAEIGAAFLAAQKGIEYTVNHTNYLHHWIAELKEDCQAIFQAASHATKASDYLLAFEQAEKSKRCWNWFCTPPDRTTSRTRRAVASANSTATGSGHE